MQFKLLAFSALMFYLFSFFYAVAIVYTWLQLHATFTSDFVTFISLAARSVTPLQLQSLPCSSVRRQFDVYSKPQIFSAFQVRRTALVPLFTSFIFTFAKTERAGREKQHHWNTEYERRYDAKVCAALQVHFDYIHVNMGILLMIKYYIALWNFAVYIGLSAVFSLLTLLFPFVSFFFFMIWTVFHVLPLSNECIYWTQHLTSNELQSRREREQRLRSRRKCHECHSIYKIIKVCIKHFAISQR